VILHGRSSTVLRRAVIAGAAALVPVLAGCEAGNNAPTSQWHQPTPGASTVLPSGTAGQLAIQNVFALGAAGDRALPAGSSAGLYLALVNTGPADRLVSASAPGTASSVRLPGNGVRVQRDQAVLFTGPAPRLILDHLTRRLMAGVDIRVTLNFQNAGSVTLSIPVMPRVDYYATFSPAPAIPTASATPKASGSATATPSATPAASVTPSASATP
jgi:copper(I)-binding protein